MSHNRRWRESPSGCDYGGGQPGQAGRIQDLQMATIHLHVAVPLEKRERSRDSLARKPQVITDIGSGHEQM
ncbi:MAG: hypothetical protein K0Q62_1125, partial [Phenylobacterium sp.]|nr:hypothetical protein [Phenylobacterium sp.]